MEIKLAAVHFRQSNAPLGGLELSNGNLVKLKTLISTGNPLIGGQMKGQPQKAAPFILSKPNKSPPYYR